ncbi:hypothetical protein DAMA08_038660 [Martiniozyma asiatica (nom. inval.)]|nr:hypothetical protein DAMA08_038660 [Martiniozyma asiatica]
MSSQTFLGHRRRFSNISFSSPNGSNLGHRRKVSECSIGDSVSLAGSVTSTYSGYSIPESHPIDISDWPEQLKSIIKNKQSETIKIPYVHAIGEVSMRYYHEFWKFGTSDCFIFKTYQPEQFMQQSSMMELFYYVKNIRLRMLMLTEFVDPSVLGQINFSNPHDKIKIQIAWTALLTIFDQLTGNLKRVFDNQVLIDANVFTNVMIHSFQKLNRKYKDFAESSAILKDYIDKGSLDTTQLEHFNQLMRAKFSLPFNDPVDLTMLLKGYILTMLSRFNEPFNKLQRSLKCIPMDELLSLYKNIQSIIDNFSPQQSASIISKFSYSSSLANRTLLYAINGTNHQREIIFTKYAYWSKLWGGKYSQGKIILFDNYLLLVECDADGTEKLSFPPFHLNNLDLDDGDMFEAMWIQFKETLSIVKSNSDDAALFKMAIKKSNDNTFAFTDKISGLQIVGVFNEVKLQFGRTGFQSMKLAQQYLQVRYGQCIDLVPLSLEFIEPNNLPISNFKYIFSFIIEKVEYLLIIDETSMYIKQGQSSWEKIFGTTKKITHCKLIKNNLFFIYNNDLMRISIENVLAKKLTTSNCEILTNNVSFFKAFKNSNDELIIYSIKSQGSLVKNTMDIKTNKILTNEKLRTQTSFLDTVAKSNSLNSHIIFSSSDKSSNLKIDNDRPLLNLSKRVSNLLKDNQPIAVFHRQIQNQLLVIYENYCLFAFIKKGWGCNIFEDRILRFNFSCTSAVYDDKNDSLIVSNDSTLDVWKLDFNKDANGVSYCELIGSLRGEYIRIMNADDTSNILVYHLSEHQKIATIGRLQIYW